MSSPALRRFDARCEPWANLRVWIEDFCKANHTSARDTWQLTLVMEELFANSVRHGYSGVKDADSANLSEWPVWVELTQHADGIHVVYEDAAFEFNPLQNIQPPDYSGPAESWRIGGLGLSMIAGIVKNMRYQRTANRNQLSLILPAGGDQMNTPPQPQP